MRKYAGFLSKVAKYGFYIVLFLCISAIGISGYVMYKARDTAKTVRESTAIEIPFPSEYKSVYSPAEILEEAKEVTEEKKEEAPKAVEKKEKEEPVKEEKKTPEKVVYTMALEGAISVPFSDGELVKSRTMDDWRIHEGVDIKGELGREVRAVSDGVIESVKDDPVLGKCIKITHSNGLQSIYANLAEEVKVKAGDKVKSGDVIGAVGSSAISECLEEPHLHLEVIENGKHIDPLSLFPEGKE